VDASNVPIQCDRLAAYGQDGFKDTLTKQEGSISDWYLPMRLALIK
jgi:hypothetical protein